jgi:hypothetical protein
LPQAVYGYLNNPLLQEELGFAPLATCFDYARGRRYRRRELVEKHQPTLAPIRLRTGARFAIFASAADRPRSARNPPAAARRAAGGGNALLSEKTREKWERDKVWLNVIQGAPMARPVRHLDRHPDSVISKDDEPQSARQHGGIAK